MRRISIASGVLIAGLMLCVANSVGAAPASSAPTFTKDIAPIFQEKCDACHRPDSVAPMSLLTYQETRPWVRSIKLRVARRENGTVAPPATIRDDPDHAVATEAA